MAKERLTKHDKEFAEIRALIRQGTRLQAHTERMQKTTKANLQRLSKSIKALSARTKAKP